MGSGYKPEVRRRAGHSVGPLAGATVLIVEDDSFSREALIRILTHYGAEVIGVGSAFEALVRLERCAPAVVISDIDLPDQDGYELVRRIRTRERRGSRRVPALAVSGLPGNDVAERARAAGFDEYLRKPIDVDALLGTLRGLIATP